MHSSITNSATNYFKSVQSLANQLLGQYASVYDLGSHNLSPDGLVELVSGLH